MPKFSAYMKGGDGTVGPPGASFISGIVSTTTQLPSDPPENRRIYLVGDSDPKYIYAYIDGEWVNQGLTASEVARADASISSVSWTEDPSVQVSFSTENQKDYFHFDFAVPKTRPAGFGTSSSASATTIAFGATPTVSITTSGEDYAKNFHFGFGIPAGEPAGFGTISATTNQVAYNVAPSVEVVAVTSSPERAKQFNFEFNIPEAYPGRVAIDSLTTKVESISTNLNSVSTRLNSVSTNLSSNFVKKSGDTINGNLTIQNSKMLYLESSTTAGLQQARIYLRPKGESNSNNLSFWYSEYDNHGAQLYQLPDYDETSSHANYYYKILTSKTPVTIEQGGTGASTSTTARANLGVVNIAGDSMTGNLYIEKSNNPALILKATTASTSIIPSDNINLGSLYFFDQTDSVFAHVQGFQFNTGENRLELSVKNGSNQNYIRILCTSTNPSIVVSNQNAWRKGIGLGQTNGALPLTIAQGGTNATSYSTAVKNLFGNDNVSTSSAHFLTITSGFNRVGYCNVASAWSVLKGNMVKADIPALDYLPIGGGTATGDIFVKKATFARFISKATGITNDTAPSTNTEIGLYGTQDSAGTWMSFIQTMYNMDKSTQLNMMIKSGSQQQNFQLKVDSNGNHSVTVTSSSAWRKGLGADSNGYWPLSVGGTGQSGTNTATATMNTTNTSTGVITCRKWGKMISVVNSTALQLKADLTSGSIAVATVPEGYRPSSNQLLLYGTTSVIGFGYVDTSGLLSLFKPSYANVPKATSIYLYATYMLT